MSKANPTRVRNRFQTQKVPTRFEGPTMTEQHHAKACDINSIMAKYLKTGVIEHMKKFEPSYGDVSTHDYEESMNTVARVVQEFDQLPAFARDHYGSPEKYLEATSTPEGLEELRSLRPKGDKYDKDGAPKKAPQEPSEAPQAPPEADSAQTTQVES